MFQHYDILTVNAVLLLSTGYGYIILGHQPTALFLLFLSLCNVIGILVGRVKDLERVRKEQEMLDDDTEEEQHEVADEEEEEEQEPDADDEAEAEAEAEEASAEEDVETRPVDVHYCGSEACGEEITNLSGAGLCAGCGLVYYCDTECQRADWRAGHKLVCDRNTSTENASEPVDQEDEIVAEPVVAEPVVEPVAEVVAPESAPVPEAAVEPVPVVAEKTLELLRPPPISIPPPPPDFAQMYPPPPPPPAARKKDIGFLV